MQMNDEPRTNREVQRIWKELSPGTYIGVITFVIWVSKAIFVLTRRVQLLASTPYLIDDSFIGMQIAHNLSKGRGYSFDGIATTTGAPPAWTWLNVPFHLALGKEAAAQATILLSAAIAGVCAILLFDICRHLFDTTSAHAAFALTSLSLPLFLQSLNGMETFLFAAVGLLIMRLALSQRPLSTSKAIWIGLLSGLLVWIRADGVFLGLLIVAWEVIFALDHPAERVKQAFVIAMILLFLTVLFLIWNHSLSGQWFPANQKGRYWIAHGYWAKWDLRSYLRMCSNNLRQFLPLYRSTLGSVALAMTGGSYIVWQLQREAQRKILPFITYIILMVFLYAFYQWYFPDVHGLRYVVFPGLILIVLLGGTVGYIAHYVRRQGTIQLSRVTTIILVVGLLNLTAVNYKRMIDGLSWTRWSWVLQVPESDMAEAWCEEAWIEERIGEHGTVAAKDIGRLSYFSSCRILDLAGIIDPEVIDFIREKNLETYLIEQEATHLIISRDPEYYLRHAIQLSGSHFDEFEEFCPRSRYMLLRVAVSR